MAYVLSTSNQFKKSAKRLVKRGYDMDILWNVIEILVETGKLPEKYYPHKLIGNYEGIWECHVKGDWLLLWQQDDQQITLLLFDTGTHSDLFK